ncbi:MAG: hypothetical protein HYU66_15705, partial [Armatimonadetes bacterium]|nr:hypothetical protein [Armatimonadota bacterium]
MPTRALLLAAHGSLENPASGLAARRHVQALRARGLFHQVAAAFWKEFPSLREAAYEIVCDDVYVVPLFMAEGYFTSRVVPRELGLEGPLTLRGGQRWHYTPAVGADPRLAEVIAGRARSALAAGGVNGDSAGLLVVGHGTVQNPRSKTTVLAHAEALRAGGGFGWVGTAWLEEQPGVVAAIGAAAADDVAVVPLFVADGKHTDEDMPRDLGLERLVGGGWRLPGQAAGKRVWYTSAVGTDPAMADVVLSLAAAAGAELEPVEPGFRPVWASAWLAELAGRGGRLEWLEAAVEPDPPGRWRLHHRADPGSAEEADLLALARSDAAGSYRELPFAPSLRRGWVAAGLSADALVEAVETLYPGSIAAWWAEREERLTVTPWREVAGRQTGHLGLVKRLPPDALTGLLHDCCDKGCLRRRRWGAETEVELRGGPVPCGEACSWFLTLARREIG